MEHNENFLLFLFDVLLFQSHSVQPTFAIRLVSFEVVPTKNLQKQS